MLYPIELRLREGREKKAGITGQRKRLFVVKFTARASHFLSGEIARPCRRGVPAGRKQKKPVRRTGLEKKDRQPISWL
jgi:hypothetical protein